MPETDQPVGKNEQDPVANPDGERKRRRLAQWMRTVFEAPGLLEPRISQMKRDRPWFEVSGDEMSESVRFFLGSYAEQIEQLLHQGKTVMEVGAGKLKTSRELATAFPTGNIVAVEPFPEQEPSKELPANLLLIPKKIEEVNRTDFANKEISYCFSVWVFDYAVDKLKFLKSIYDLLEDDGIAVTLSSNFAVSDPPLSQIFDAVGASNLMTETQANGGDKLIILRKMKNQPLDFSQFSLTAAPHAGGGTIISHYTQKNK